VAVHPWIIFKRAGETRYTRYEVISWGSGDKVRRNSKRCGSGASPAESRRAVAQPPRSVVNSPLRVACARRAGETRYTRYEVISWGSGDKVRRNSNLPDGYWYGASRPM
jgi:hypothetical protein